MLKENRINNINLDLRVYPIYQTVRFRLSQEEKFTSNGGCSNAGLTSYALELICNNDSLFLNTNSEELNNLYNLICSEAIIKDDNTAWWRWEKIPSRDDYLYPIDWDDQFKAMDAIHSYEKRLNINAPFNLPNVTQLIDAISSGIYESNIVGEDIKLSTPNTTALYMFDERDGEKIGNKEDVFVTAVVLESAFRHGLYAHSDSFRLLAIKLFARLTHLAKEGLSSQLPFHTLSRCYISWAHFLFLLKKISEYLSVDISINDLICLYKQKLADNPLTAIESVNESHDKFYRQILGIFHPNIGKDFSQNKSAIVYRHRRLAHFYGSNIWDLSLKNI